MKEVLANMPYVVGKKNKKNLHRLKAEELYPSLKHLFCGSRGGVKDGNVDALLISEFGRRVFKGEAKFNLTSYVDEKFKGINTHAKPLDIKQAIDEGLEKALELHDRLAKKSYKRAKEKRWLISQKLELKKIHNDLNILKGIWRRKDQIGWEEETDEDSNI